MKVRKGFVSNSSSASFTIRWKWTGEPKSLKEILKSIFEFDHRTHDDALINEIEKHTAEINGEYATYLWTTMLNCYGDLGEVAEAFFFYLSMNRPGNAFEGQTELIEFKVEEDY